MIQAQRPVQALLAELANLLDTEIKILDLRGRQMVAMRRHISDRDDAALGSLLAEIEETRDFQETSQYELLAIHRVLAQVFCYEGDGEMRLSWLIPQLSPNDQTLISYRRQQIVELSAVLHREHTHTSMLLRECMRINRLLLENLLPRDETAGTYEAGGRAAWRPQVGLVDTEL